MACLKRKKLSLSERHRKVLRSPLITMTKKAVNNLDLVKDHHGQKYLQLWNGFKTAVSLRRDR